MAVLRRLILAGLTPLLVMASASAMEPSSALAVKFVEHEYCLNWFAPGETCPPSGSSEYMHLEHNFGNSIGEKRAVCVDAYLVSWKTYTEQRCEYTEEHDAEQYTAGEYGYPRAWNAGKAAHWVWALEKGYLE